MPEDALFDTLYREHHRVLFAYLLGQVGKRESAEDLLQETFVRVWRHISEAQQIPVERLRYWLLRIARNLVLDFRRRQSVRAREEAVVLPALPEQDPVEATLNRERGEALDRAIQCLPDDLRTVLTLHLVGEMTSAEVGQLLERPAGTVRYQLAQARKRLAKEVL